MRHPILFFFFLFSCCGLRAQSTAFIHAREWKLYDTRGQKGMQVPADNLGHFPSLVLDSAIVNSFLARSLRLPEKETPLWMGYYTLSYVYTGTQVSKLYFSVYGGFGYTECGQRYFRLPAAVADAFLQYLQEQMLRLNTKKN